MANEVKKLPQNLSGLPVIEPPLIIPHGAFLAPIIGAAGATAIGVAAGTIAAEAALTYFLMSAALGVAMVLLTPKPETPVDHGYQVNTVGGANDQAVIYGETVVGGPVIYDEVTDGNKFLHRVIALAGHVCESIETVFFDDEPLTLDASGVITAPAKWAGKARVKLHLGDQTTADADLVSESDGLWTASHVGFGICYLYVRLLFDRDAFPRGVPKITAKVKGKKVYDPRTSTTAWSDNAALCARDYIVSEYGMNVPASNVDDTAISVAANVCDETVPLSNGSTQKRYTCNGTFTTGSDRRKIVMGLHTAMAGVPVYGQSDWKSIAGAYTAPVKLLTEDDLRGDILSTPRHSISQNFNSVSGLFKGPETNYKPTDYPAVKSATFLAEDAGNEQQASLDLPFTDNSPMAQRLAKIALYRNREQITIQAPFGLNAWDVEVGEIVKFTYARWGFNEKTFEVTKWKFGIQNDGDITITLTLREISAGVFDWNAEEQTFIANNTTLPDPWVTAAAGLTVSDELRSINEKVTAVLMVDVTSTDAGYVQNFEVQARRVFGIDGLTSDWQALGIGSVGRYELLDVQDGTFDIRARTINSFGVRGPWTIREGYVVDAYSEPPSDVVNFGASVVGGSLTLTWDAVEDLDLSYYTIRFSADNAPTYTTAETVRSKVSRPATSVTIPFRAGTYFIRAVDKMGNESVNATSVSTTVLAVEQMNAVATADETHVFGGTHSNTSVTTNAPSGLPELVITDTTSAPRTGTYSFQNMVDLGAKYTSRVYSVLGFIREDAAGALFDSTGGLFDDQNRLFDGPEYNDINVKLQISVTDDDPSGTPTWSAWHDLTAGDYSARALRFRAVLATQTDGVTPRLQTCKAVVDMPDRVLADSNVSSGAAAYTVTFSPAFKTLTGIGVAPHNLNSGDTYAITAKSATGFTIEFKDSGGTTVDRTFDWVARGYGSIII